MKLSLVNTKRSFEHRAFYDIVYEWEDDICDTLKIPLLYEYRPNLMYKNLRNRYVRKIPLLNRLLYPHKMSLCFDMDPVLEPRFNSENIIPWCIDFYLNKQLLPLFNAAYKNHPVVFISCVDAFNFICQNHNLCPDVNIKHLSLSLPTKYCINPQIKFVKKFDVLLVGRQDELLMSFFERYILSYPSISYVYRECCNGHFNYYTNTGEFIGNADSRENYIELLRCARVTLYSTSFFLQEETQYRKNFAHVTPRFLEMISAGCHVLSRYISNADTEFYEFRNLTHSINTYEDFENALNYSLSHDVDMELYSSYLKKHYTSYRTTELINILSDL